MPANAENRLGPARLDEVTAILVDDLLDRVGPHPKHVAPALLIPVGFRREETARDICIPDERPAHAARIELAALDLAHPDMGVLPDRRHARTTKSQDQGEIRRQGDRFPGRNPGRQAAYRR